MAAVNMKDGIYRLLKKENLTHGIQVTISEDNRIILCFFFIYNKIFQRLIAHSGIIHGRQGLEQARTLARRDTKKPGFF